MEYDEFIRRIQRRAGLSSSAEAVRIGVATLETLGECLEKTERTYLASLLPPDLRGYLLEKKSTAGFALDEFYSRISSRAGINFPQAIKQAHAVMSTLHEAVPEGELEDVLSCLPDEFREISGKRD